MKLKNSFLLALLLLVTFLSPFKVSAQSGEILPSGIPYDQIGTEIEAFVKEHEATTAGMAVAVFDKDQVIYQKTFGYEDIALQRPVTADSVFEWGSVSKLVVWASVMQLWEQGKIDLEEDIRSYLPEGFLTRLKFDQPITMLHLMSHRAGFQETLVNIFTENPSAITTLEAALRDSEPPQVYQPGEFTAYSNWGSTLAAYIVERISGKPYDQYVHENFFSPLGMNTTAIKPDLSDNPEVQKRTRTMLCYDGSAKPLAACKFYIPLYPAGMITGTLGDFLKFAQALIPSGHANTIIFKHPATLQTMLEATSYYPGGEFPRIAHGFLVQYYGVQVFGHGGNTAGQSAHLLLDPVSGSGMVLMTNQAAESVYNNEMPELIFGKFDPAKHNMASRTLPTGFFEGKRNVITGPLSLFKMSGLVMMEEGDLDDFWVVSQQDGREILSYTVADFEKVSSMQLGVYVIYLLLIVIGVVGGLVTLITSTFRAIRKKTPEVVERQRAEKPLLRWRNQSWMYLLLQVLLVAALVVCGMTYQGKGYFYTVLAGFILLFLLMGWQLVRLYLKTKMSTLSAKEKRANIWVASLLALSMFFILYWQLYQLWNL